MHEAEFRMTKAQRVVIFLAPAVLLLGSLQILREGDRQDAIGMASCGAVLVVFGLLYNRFGVVMTPHGLTLRGLRRRTFPWEAVLGIFATSYLPARRTAIQLSDGRTLRAWAPWSQLTGPAKDVDFDFWVDEIGFY